MHSEDRERLGLGLKAYRIIKPRCLASSPAFAVAIVPPPMRLTITSGPKMGRSVDIQGARFSVGPTPPTGS